MSAIWTGGIIFGVYFALDILVYMFAISQTLTGYVHAFTDDK